MRPRLKGQHGQVLAVMAFMLAIFLGLAAIAVDTARLAHTVSEVQTAAESAAAAAATALIESNGDGAAAVAQGQQVMVQNRVNGQPASVAAADFSIAGNRVTVTARASVQNFFAGVFQSRNTTFEKSATAGFTSIASSRPTLPLAIGDCHFTAFQNSLGCQDLPSPTNAPSGSDNTGWTSFTDPAPPTPDGLQPYLPADCFPGATTPPALRVGDPINFVEGSAAALLDAIDGCVAAGIDTFKIPVVPCAGGGKLGPSLSVSGFATLVIRPPVPPTGINGDVVCNAKEPGKPGGGNFGTGFIVLMN